jgi:hypothetical protein
MKNRLLAIGIATTMLIISPSRFSLDVWWNAVKKGRVQP